MDLLTIGVEKGYYQFTSHLIAELIRVVSKGSAPGNNLLMDTLYSIIALVSHPQSTSHPSLLYMPLRLSIQVLTPSFCFVSGATLALGATASSLSRDSD